jgi:putative FmdB family regulatory protein
MPTYTYECKDCGEPFEKILKLAQYKDPQDCPFCNSANTIKTITGAPGMILKGDGWSGKNLRIKRQMQEKNKRLAAKEREYKGDGMIPSLAPNVGGERVDSWSEAKKLAADKGKDTSGYDRYIQKEKSK